MLSAFSKLTLGSRSKGQQRPKATAANFSVLQVDEAQEEPEANDDRPSPAVEASSKFVKVSNTFKPSSDDINNARLGEVDVDEKWQTVENRPRTGQVYENVLARRQALTAQIGQTTPTWQTHGNWRDRDPAQQRARGARTMHADLTQKSGSRMTGLTRKSRMTYEGGRRIKNGMLFYDQDEGAIVWRWDDRPCDALRIPDNAEGIHWQPDGSRWRRKGRYWIVVEASETKVKEVPIYTNGDTGLKKTPQKSWWEYCSVRPEHMSPTSFKNQSPDNKLLEVKWMHLDGKLARSTMVVHWTEVHERDLDIMDVRLVGHLAEESTANVCAKALGPKACLYRA